MLSDIQKLVDSDIIVVPTPDHPVLMTPPDVLVAKNGRLLAYFKLHSNERANPNRLLSRLVLCRFAFPVHTQYIFLIDGKLDNKKCQDLYSFFDHVVELGEIKSSLSLLKSPTNNITVERAREGREEHYIKYNVLYEESLKQICSEKDEDRFFRVNPSNFERAFYTDWVSEPDIGNRRRKKKSKYFYRSTNYYFAVPEFSKIRRRHDFLRNLCIASVLIAYDYEGRPNGRFNFENGFVLSEDLPGYKHDSLKGIRSASFSGLGLSHVKNEDSLDKYSQYLSYRLERAWHEFQKKKNRYNKRNRNR